MEIELIDGVAVIKVQGSMDIESAPQIAAFIERQMDAGHTRLVVDLAGVDYTSSAGLRALLGSVKEARRRGGDLRLCSIGENVLKVLTLSGFTSIVKHYPDASSAVRSY
jgi:anti-anti-sigma factor